MDRKYPQVQVQLTGEDGNAFMILGLVSRAMKEAGIPPDEIAAFHQEATTADYEHLLRTAQAWVEVR